MVGSHVGLDLNLPCNQCLYYIAMIVCKFDSSSGEVYSIQLFVSDLGRVGDFLWFVSDLGRVGDFLWVLNSLPGINLT
jgi:hypothetical protein